MIMISLEVTDIKSFTNELFIGDSFNDFLVSEVSISTSNTFKIDGNINTSFYSTDELEQLGSSKFVKWKRLKPICFHIIKGNRLPSKFKMTFLLSGVSIAKFLKDNPIGLQPENINALALNIRYENHKITCITGTSLNIFTMDKSLENLWDSSIEKFIKW